MSILALAFKAHETARVEEIAGALTAIAGALLFFAAMTPMARRMGQIFAGIALAGAGILFVLAIRYGVRPK